MGAIELGQLIRSARLRKGWQQQDLANRLSVDRSYISQLETGKRNWPKTYIRPLSEALGISETEMAEAAGMISAGTVDEDQDLPDYDAMRKDLVRLAERIAPVKLETAIRLLRALHESRTGWT